jgi:hypothetical protein
MLLLSIVLHVAEMLRLYNPGVVAIAILHLLLRGNTLKQIHMPGMICLKTIVRDALAADRPISLPPKAISGKMRIALSADMLIESVVILIEPKKIS